jgi:hypothetical protein
LCFFKVFRGNQEKAKAGFNDCQVGCRENKLDSMPRGLKEKNNPLKFNKADCRKKKFRLLPCDRKSSDVFLMLG